MEVRDLHFMHILSGDTGSFRRIQPLRPRTSQAPFQLLVLPLHPWPGLFGRMELLASGKLQRPLACSTSRYFSCPFPLLNLLAVQWLRSWRVQQKGFALESCCPDLTHSSMTEAPAKRPARATLTCCLDRSHFNSLVVGDITSIPSCSHVDARGTHI